MSLPGVNFCLKDSEVQGKWCWVDSNQSSDLKHFQEKDLRVVFVSIVMAAVLCCLHLCSPGPLVGVRAACRGMKHAGGRVLA